RRHGDAMSSATIWFRLEPRPRADTLDPDALAEALRARLRDPLWMLTRQWQLGEFLGADSGSPAYVQLTERQTRLASWQRAGRAIDGVALHAAARASLPALPAQPASLSNPPKTTDPGALAARRAAGLAALDAFVLWVDATLGVLGKGDPPSWSPERLEYRLE